MNTITTNPPTSEFNCGDIFTLNNREFYILGVSAAHVGAERYTCINLSSGSSRNGLHKNKEAAIDDLTFYGRDMKITIQP